MKDENGSIHNRHVGKNEGIACSAERNHSIACRMLNFNIGFWSGGHLASS